MRLLFAVAALAAVVTLSGCAERVMDFTPDHIRVEGQTGLLVKPDVSVSCVTVATDTITTTTQTARWNENAQPAIDWADVVLGAVVALVVALGGGL